MYKVLKRTCWAIVLPIRSFVFPRPRFRRRRGLLKVLSDSSHPSKPSYLNSKSIIGFVDRIFFNSIHLLIFSCGALFELAGSCANKTKVLVESSKIVKF